jgi:hypothetical protein
MTDVEFSYHVTEDEYSKRLAIAFEYNEEINDSLNSLSWDKTHRRWYSDEGVWVIDWTTDSIELFEDEFGVEVPQKYKPDTDNKEEISMDSEIDDALSEIDEWDYSGHGLTMYPSTTCIEEVTVSVYNIILETGIQAEDNDRQRSIARNVIRDIQRKFPDRAPPMVHTSGLEIASLYPLPDDFSIRSEEAKRLTGAGERTLSVTNQAERNQIERLFEEEFKRIAKESRYQPLGIHKILEKSPIPIESGTGYFQLHRRYNCSVSIKPSGQVYLQVNPATSVQSEYTLDKIPDSRIYPGLRVNTTYSSRGHNVSHIGNKTANEKMIDAETSVVDYHENNPDVDSEKVSQIERNNNPVVEASPMGKGERASFPQELLALQGHTENLAEFDPDFWDQAQSKMRMSTDERAELALDFVESIGGIQFDEYSVTFSTEYPLFTGDNHYELTKLYDTRAAVLDFGNGNSGHMPKQVEDYGVYKPPKSFNVAYIYPEPLEGDYAEEFWSNIEQKLKSIGASPDGRTDITYQPTKIEDKPGDADHQVGEKIRTDHDFNVALVVLPPEQGPLASYYRPYDEMKEVLSDFGIPSQMCNRESMGERSHHTNIALGMVGAAGGIPFTVESSLPGDADLFLAFDVGEQFEESNSNNDRGIRVGASVTAITSEGAVLGYSHTGPQSGERIPASHMRSIARQSILGYSEKKGEDPEHIVIHRDGFLNDPIDEVFDLLESRGITYDVVEVRKQSPSRILDHDSACGFRTPEKGVACIDEEDSVAYLSTYGRPEPLAKGNMGTPRPITVEKKHGSTSIDTLASQVYLLSQCHIGVSNTTCRLPITTMYADKAATAAAKGQLPITNELETGIGFL